MHLAPRMSALRPSLTIGLNTKARALRAQGIGFHSLAQGEPGIPTPSAIVQRAMATMATGHVYYSTAGGTAELRRAVVAKYKRENQLDYREDEVVCGCGTKEVLLHSFLSILARGDEVILLAPHWVSYLEQAKICEAKAVVVPYDATQPLPRVEQLARWATPRTRAIVLNFPHNPTGHVPSRAAYEELGAYLQSQNWWIISDEIYEYLNFNNERRHYSILNVCPQLRDRTILINGLSKGFAMTGWRVGYALGNKDIIANIRKLQSHSTTCLPSFTESAAIFALTQGKTLMQEMIDTIATKLQKLQQWLRDMLPELVFTPAQGAFYTFPQLPAWLTRTSCPTALAFSEWLFDKHKLIVVPGESFGVERHIRLSCTAPERYTQEALALLAKGLQELKKTT